MKVCANASCIRHPVRFAFRIVFYTGFSQPEPRDNGGIKETGNIEEVYLSEACRRRMAATKFCSIMRATYGSSSLTVRSNSACGLEKSCWASGGRSHQRDPIFVEDHRAGQISGNRALRQNLAKRLAIQVKQCASTRYIAGNSYDVAANKPCRARQHKALATISEFSIIARVRGENSLSKPRSRVMLAATDTRTAGRRAITAKKDSRHGHGALPPHALAVAPG